MNDGLLFGSIGFRRIPLPVMPVANSIDWEKRIQRAAELAERYPSAREVLAFYGHILDFQSKLRTPLRTDLFLHRARVSLFVNGLTLTLR